MLSSETRWNLIAAGSAAAAGFGVRQGLRAAWRHTRGEDPPRNPASRDTPWRDAILWTAATGVAVGLGRLVARRGVTAGWRKAKGRLPPGISRNP